MKSRKVSFFEYAQAETTLPVEPDTNLIRHFELFSSIVKESGYILDIKNRQFCYIQPNNLFLCDYSVEEAFSLGYDFYEKIVYGKDLHLWALMHKAILLYLNENKDYRDDIDSFFCTFRLQRKVSFLKNPLPQMVYQQMKPVWEEHELRYLICTIDSSTAKESGNLLIFSKNGRTHKEYRIASRLWKHIMFEALTERERAILLLAQQGKTVKEIADDLYKGCHTIHNQITELFFKMEVHSMQEAIDLASNRRMIYISKQDTAELKEIIISKRVRVLITDDMMQCIQTYLDSGLSIRKTAVKIGVSESTIRYRKEKLKNNFP